MLQSICSNCGADAFITKEGYKVCKYCNTRYQVDKDDIPKVSATVSVRSDIEMLLQKCKDDPTNVRRYANRILDIDPTNHEALSLLKKLR